MSISSSIIDSVLHIRSLLIFCIPIHSFSPNNNINDIYVINDINGILFEFLYILFIILVKYVNAYDLN